jgi:RimJ/RimL family protein N-acetyltransferase
MFDKDKLEFGAVEDKDFLIKLYDVMMHENTDTSNTLFYNVDSESFSHDDLVNMMDGSRTITVASYNNIVAAFMTLEPIFGNTIGSVGYYGFKWVRGRYTVGIGKAYLDMMLEHYNTLVGLSPINNKISIKFNEKIGMKEVGVIKNACYVAKEKRHTDGLLTTITKT